MYQDNYFQHNFGCAFPKPSELRPIMAKKVFDFGAHLKDLHFASMDIGPYGDVLVSLDNCERVWDNKWNERYQNFLASGKARFKILHMVAGQVVELDLNEYPGSHLFVQPMPDNKYLLTSGWSRNGYKNAKIINIAGEELNQFDVGDDIEALQVSANGNIWVGYGDEGVFGGTDGNKLSQNIFSCFDLNGNLLFPHQPLRVFGAWCLGMNVDSDDSTWLTSDNGLVQLSDFTVSKNFPDSPPLVAKSFAIKGHYACFTPMRNILTPDFNFFTIANLHDGRCEFYQAVDGDGQALSHTSYGARSSKVFFVSGHEVYMFDLADEKL